MDSTIKTPDKQLQIKVLTITTPPTTSSSSYHLLTRNDSTGVVEKVASGGFIPYSGASDSVNLGLFDLTAETLMSSSIISSDFYVNNKIDISGSNPTLSILDGVSYVHKVNTTTFFGGTNYFSVVKIYPSFDEKQLRFDFSNITNNETSILTIPDKDGTIALTSDLSTQIEVGANSDVLESWMNDEVIFTASCTITVPATLPTNFNFNFLTLAGVTVTWAITAPHTWLFGTPTNTIEKTYGRMVKRNSTNSIIMLD